MDLITRYLAIIMVFIFTNNQSGIAQSIELQPDSFVRYVMDPATFQEDANSNSIWKLAPSAEKILLFTDRAQKIMVNQLLKPARINPFQV
ncbi:hypothetical protein L6773_05650 [Rhodohalobacter sp. WB101]|uniref:Uncharacterized protein n=1 Tax=Rhodohalobacter sulfatireducens TaxID=2911366 RepID=A0ABS9KB06_9BACT|nr:hypothetical protein [Rhodohalobacter sulfatireducens]